MGMRIIICLEFSQLLQCLEINVYCIRIYKEVLCSLALLQTMQSHPELALQFC